MCTQALPRLCRAVPPLSLPRAQGFTLIEMSLVILIVGIVFSGLVLGIPRYVHSLKTAETQVRMDRVMDALSVYAQRHYRLPCPADPAALTAARGTERVTGDRHCFSNATDRALYQATEGVVPWRELGLSERDVVDAWGRYMTYKPAPQLTVDTYDTAMQGGRDELDIHNACRVRTWFDNTGTDHVNRQKALFCCNSPPKDNYLTARAGTSVAQVDLGTWLNNAIAPATRTPLGGGALPPATNVESTNRWIDRYRGTDSVGAFSLAGSFASIHNTDADPPLLRASGHAVTLISHGGNGYAAPLRRQAARMGFGAASVDETDPFLGAPEALAARKFHPQASIGGAYDRASLLAGASDDLVSFLRSDQLFARAGAATCVRPASIAGLPSGSTPSVPCSGYGDAMYVIDTSGSMAWKFAPGISRIAAVKKAMAQKVTIEVFDPVTRAMVPKEYSILSGYIDGEASRDANPDDVGVTYLTSGPLAPSSVLLNYDPVTRSRVPLNRPGASAAALAKGEALVVAAPASGGTALFQTVMESVKLMGDGTRTEPTAIVVLSDGYDNSSGMGATCEPQERSSACRVSLRTNKTLVVNTMSSRYGMRISPEARDMINDGSVSREALFGKILGENYPHVVVHIIDVAGNEKLKDVTDQIVPDTENPIRSLYRHAADEASLREFVTGLSGVCTRPGDTVAYQ